MATLSLHQLQIKETKIKNEWKLIIDNLDNQICFAAFEYQTIKDHTRTDNWRYKQAYNKKIVMKDIKYNYIINEDVKCPKKWHHTDKKSGIIKLIFNEKNIYILPHIIINANYVGYYTRDLYKNIDTQLKNIYCNDFIQFKESNKDRGGGGIVYIICKNLYNYGSIICNGKFNNNGGSIFILGNNVVNHGFIFAKGNNFSTQRINNDAFDGKIAIYCNKLKDEYYISPKPYVGTFEKGQQISKNHSEKETQEALALGYTEQKISSFF